MNCHFKLQVCVKANSIWNGLSKMFHSFIQIRVVCISCVYVIPQEPLYYDIINYSTYTACYAAKLLNSFLKPVTNKDAINGARRSQCQLYISFIHSVWH